VLILFCCGCTGEPVPVESTETIPCTEVPQTQHIHTFGDWEPALMQMQRTCTECGEAEVRDMTDEEQFLQLLNGHWEPYEVTFMGETKLVYYIRTGVWYYYVDYAEGDTLSYTAALSNSNPADSMRPLLIQYSHYDSETKTHHVAAVSEEGRNYQIALETNHTEPLLYVIPEPQTDMFDRIAFSRYAQVAPVAPGTWSCIQSGKILSLTLNPDQTFSSNIEAFPSGTWQLSPPDGGDDGHGVCTIQLFYKDENGQSVFELGVFFDGASNIPGVEADLPDLDLVIYNRNNDMWHFRKLQPEQLQPLLDRGENAIIGTWDSKSTRSFIGEDTAPHIQTGYTLTINEDGTFTMMADRKVSGTWIFDESSTSGSGEAHHYLFTYPGSSKRGERITYYPQSGNLSFCYKAGKVIYLTFAHYSDAQWADFLAGPALLPGSYVSQKIVRYDKQTNLGTEEPETGYRLTINEDGTVTGTLHKDVSGIWFYEDTIPGEGHRYIFRMDHTPPEQSSQRNSDGTLVFDTKIDGEHVIIYFYPE